MCGKYCVKVIQRRAEMNYPQETVKLWKIFRNSKTISTPHPPSGTQGHTLLPPSPQWSDLLPSPHLGLKTVCPALLFSTSSLGPTLPYAFSVHLTSFQALLCIPHILHVFLTCLLLAYSQARGHTLFCCPDCQYFLSGSHWVERALMN